MLFLLDVGGHSIRNQFTSGLYFLQPMVGSESSLKQSLLTRREVAFGCILGVSHL